MHAPAESEMAKTVLVCGKLFDGLSDTIRGPPEILIDDDAIAEVSNSVGRPGGAKVVDLSNRTVSPGFIDTHIHLCVELLQCSPAKALAGLYYAKQYMRTGSRRLIQNGRPSISVTPSMAVWLEGRVYVPSGGQARRR
jgi:imidazolonepropionase-like amidohydrolase